MDSGSYVVETKVQAATGAALAAGALIWALETYVFSAALPGVLADLIYWLVPALAALAAGWLAPHTPRGGSQTSGGDGSGPSPASQP